MAQEEAYPAVEQGTGAAPVQKPRTGIFGFGVIGLLLCIVGLLIWWMVLRTESRGDAETSSTSAVKAVVPLESFTVNLADAEDGSFLRVTMALGVDGRLPPPAKSESAPDNPVSIPAIRDTILSVLAQCKSGELLTVQGKTKLKADLIQSLDQNVPALQAREVYFTEFLVQR